MQKTRNGARRSRNLWRKNAHADTLDATTDAASQSIQQLRLSNHL